MRRMFDRTAEAVTDWSGSVWATLLAVVLVGSWLLGLFWFGLANTNYQLIINTTTTIITFIMVFLIQHSTNRGTRAIQVKLDALIEAQEQANNILVGAEDLPIEELKKLQEEERSSVKDAIAGAAQEGAESGAKDAVWAHLNGKKS